ncbi:competence protein ComEC family protein [Subsaxibacter sp. CAU 1640]|uniref:ComEC/Rec2 family competence protein n=1 Tax=Subsaxibacter sp. CAU 1640 TaxID=2933271 RepID=UPI0020044D2C|nr:ComEC/Rec2 family competence protein [Subsaxibacter sp. CAU 1640]MCK7590276.1 competence protein ComEC family protein [Subsaxibacter sp. CAU 1640]
MKLLNFAIIKFTICLIVGISIAYFFTVSLDFSIYATICLSVILLIIYLIDKRTLKKTIWFGMVSFLLMICVGILTYNLHDQRQFADHYTKIISTETNSSSTITLEVREVLKPTAYHHKYIVDVLKVDNQSVSGKLLLNVQKDSLSNPLKVDEVLITTNALQNINSPLNPYQFNYREYLERQYVYHQVYADEASLLKATSNTESIFGYAENIRHKVTRKLTENNFKKDELAIIESLLLGKRKDISPDRYNNYVNAGVIHILAVSGLHVGIIMYILFWIFAPIGWLKNGNYFKMALVVILLWCFAIIAGLSPSVTRAVTMFTFVAIARNLKKPTNIFNTLASSMFILLLFKPMFLFEVGFQLSYAAVLSIVIIQPLIQKLWTPKNKALKYLWTLICVTTAAQIGVAPISLFYFHQFPGLFFISNLVILPFLGFVLAFGIVVIILALIDFLPYWIAKFYETVIWAMNTFVDWVAHQERFIFKDVSFSIVTLVASYVLILGIIHFLKNPNYHRLMTTLCFILMLQGVFIYEKYQNQTDEFVIFHKSRKTIIGNKTNSYVEISSNLDSASLSKENSIKSYKVGNNISKVKISELQSIYEFENKKLLVIDSFAVYNVKSFMPDYVLLCNSPKINLDRLIDSLQPKTIVADGSNYKTYIENWKSTCVKRKVPFHSTYEMGAFILSN